MGCDPEAIIYYGFPLGDYGDGEDSFSFADRLSETWTKARCPKKPADKTNYKTPEWDEWRKNLRQWEESPENIRMDWSGAEDCEAWYVHAAGFKQSVEWNEQLPLVKHEFGPRPEADNFLREFCKHANIERQQPGWHLAARYW